MTHTLPNRNPTRTRDRTVSILLIVTLLFLLPLAALRPAQAAPTAQGQGLCALVPPGYDPAVVTNMEDYCHVVYDGPNGATFFLELVRFYSPETAYQALPCDPAVCASGGVCNGSSCQAQIAEDPSGGPGARSATIAYSTGDTGGIGYARTRGCYQLKGQTFGEEKQALEGLWALLMTLDQTLVASGPCAGCKDPSVCQETGSGGDSSTGGNEAALAVAAPSCNYLATEDRVLCTTQVTSAPANADVVFTWWYDGAVQESAGSGLDIIVSPDGRDHTVQVSAQNRASGKASEPQASIVRTGVSSAGGRVQIVDGSGKTIADADPPYSTNVALNAEDGLAKVLANCPLLGLVLLLEIGYDPALSALDPSPQLINILIAALVIDCARMQAKGDGALYLASLSDTALARAAQGDAPAQLQIDLQSGPLRVKAGSDQVQLDVRAAGVTVRSAGRNDFGVSLDSETGAIRINVYGGNVQVHQNNTGLEVASLEAGQQVDISPDGASVASRGDAGPAAAVASPGATASPGASVIGPSGSSSGQPGGPSAPLSRRSTTTALALCCLPLAVLVLGVVVLVSRRRKHKAAERVAPAAPPAVEPQAASEPFAVEPSARETPVRQSSRIGPPSPPAAPKPNEQTLLVVLQGAARRPMLSLAGGEAVLGRDPSCSLVLDDPLISPRHASVSWDGAAWVLTDLGSKNGTFVNGARVKRQALRPGDAIQLGTVRLAFQTEG